MKVFIAVPTAQGIPSPVRKGIENCAAQYERDGGRTTLGVVEGQPVCGARRTLVELALRERADAVFFVDDDTLLQKDGLVRLASHGDDFVTGVVFRRLPDQDNHACIGWQRERLGGLWQYADDWSWPDYFDVHVCGLAAALIHTEVFKRIRSAGSKWFDFNWFFEHPGMPGRKTLVPQGEDIHLCLAAGRAGCRIMCDSSVRCGHLDRETGRVYPSAEKWAEFRRDAGRVRCAESPRLRQFILEGV